MDAAKTRTWVAKQIEDHSPEVGAPSKAARLAVAAAALKPASHSVQVFGLELPDRRGLEDLYERCLALLAAWPRVLDARTSGELAALMVQLGLPPCAEPTPAPRTAVSLHVFLPVEVQDLETGDPTSDERVLAVYEGARAAGGDRLADIECIRRATGGSSELVGVHEDYGWAHGSAVELTRDDGRGVLRCRLTFELSRAPLESELLALLEVVERELLFTGWGLNLEWDKWSEEADYHVHLKSKIDAYQLAGGQVP